MTTTSEVTSTFQKRPAYRYIRKTDKLPTYDELEARRMSLNDIVAKVRLFNPTGIGTWWIAAYDPDTGIAWGVAELFERETGDFSMNELVDFRGKFGLPIERDLYWTPTTLAEVMAGAR